MCDVVFFAPLFSVIRWQTSTRAPHAALWAPVSATYTLVLRHVSTVIVYDAQYLRGFIKALHQATDGKKQKKKHKPYN